MAKDYYKTLGVAKNASQEEIKSAYKKLAKQYHPDLNKAADASDKFKEINEAAAVLGDPQKRQQYDQFGSADPNGSGMGGFDFRDFQNQGFNFDDIFENMFAGFGFGGARRRGPQRGHDLITDVDVTFEDVAKGVTKSVTVNRNAVCSECEGSGAASGGSRTCDTCKGSGSVKQTRRTPFGYFATQTACKACDGTGELIEHPCSACDGEGRVEESKELDVKIPAGIEDGMRLRLEGEGEAGERNAPTGDLYVTVHVLPHKVFVRDGNNLRLTLPITFATAALGGELDVPTLDGKETIKIPHGTQPGTEFRLKGHGFPNLRGYGTGSILVHVTIDVPDKLTKRQVEILKEFDGIKKKGWF